MTDRKRGNLQGALRAIEEGRLVTGFRALARLAEAGEAGAYLARLQGEKAPKVN
jgi:hypothetical protein